MPPMTFRSKVDTWLAVLVFIAAFSVLAAVVSAGLFDPRSWPFGLALLVISVGLPAWIYGSTCYDLDDHSLHIRSGPLRWRIPIADISAMTETRNPLGSPALSLDRLQIQYGGGKVVMISPMSRDAFVRAVNARKAHAA